jgi:hypothetical protein
LPLLKLGLQWVNNMELNITISKKEYEELLEDQKLLRCLQDAGVDNWSGYDYAMEMMKEME